MQATYSIRLRQRGQLTLPQAVRRDLAVDKGDVLTLVQIDDLAVLTRRSTLLPKLSEEFIDIMATLRKEGKAVLIASHDPLIYTSDIVERVVELRDGKIVLAGHQL